MVQAYKKSPFQLTFFMTRTARFAVAYALYAAVVLGYAYRMLTDPAGALFSPSHTTLSILTAVSLALPVLDAMSWDLLRPERIGRVLLAVLFIGVLAEAAAGGSLNVADLLSVAMRLLTYLIVLTIAIVLYQMVRPRESTPGRDGNAVKHHTS